MAEYTSIRVSESVKELLDEDWREGETRDQQMKRLLAGDEVPPGFLEVKEMTEEELESIRERMEQIPERTADELEGRFR